MSFQSLLVFFFSDNHCLIHPFACFWIIKSELGRILDHVVQTLHLQTHICPEKLKPVPITLQGHWAHKHRAPNIIISGPFHHGGKCLRKKDRNVTMPECKAGGPSRGSTARTGTRAGTCSRCQFTQHCSIKSCVRYDDLKALLPITALHIIILLKNQMIWPQL